MKALALPILIVAFSLPALSQQVVNVTVADSCGFKVTTSSPVSLNAVVDTASGVTVVSVQFTIDGANIGPLITVAPYTLILSGATMPSRNCHQVGAKAIDSNGNSGMTSVAVSFTK
jgi:hypothetical protein